jgi:3-oxoacyl-[acyl-carrier-protein] synthase-3
LPELAVENSRFSEIVDTNDEWISSRTGIKSRYLCSGEATWEIGAAAAKQAIDMAGIAPEQIDMIIVTTITPDYISPNMACIIQNEIKAINASCFDLNEACTGFIQAFDIAVRYLATSDMQNILIVSAESMSKLTDFSDRRSCVLFGDGAGAVVLAKDDTIEPKRYESFFGADGSSGYTIVSEAYQPAKHPFIPAGQMENKPLFDHKNGPYVAMEGQEVYRFATTKMPFAIERVLEKNGLSLDEIDYIVPHQANSRILQSAAKRLKIPEDKIISHLADIGNTSSSSIPICLDREVRSGKIQRGQKLVFTGFGGGLTYGALLCEF